MTSSQFLRTGRLCTLVIGLCIGTSAVAQSPTAAEVEQWLDHVTFGPTPADRQALLSGQTTLASYLTTQLNPTFVEPAELNTLIGQLALPATTFEPPGTAPTYSVVFDLQRSVLLRMLRSQWQLNEYMTQFWENLFSTNANNLTNPILGKMNAAYGAGNFTLDDVLHYGVFLEKSTNDAYRLNALGKFRDLIEITVRSPAMMIFLNSDGNTDPPNENFARELLELYTMGTTHSDGSQNYRQADIVECAQTLTGLFVQASDLSQQYNINLHTSGNKGLFRNTAHPLLITSTGEQQIEDLLDHLASIEATKDFICRRIVAYIIADEAAEPGAEDQLLTDMKNAWGTEGDIAAVLQELFDSNAFLGATYAGCRARSPIERATWWIRTWGASMIPVGDTVPNVDSIFFTSYRLLFLGQDLFLHPSPDGYDMSSENQPSSSGYIDTTALYTDVYRVGLLDYLANPVMDISGIVQAGLPVAQHEDPSAIAQFLVDHVYPGRGTAADVQAIANVLAADVNGVPTNLDTTSPDYPDRINLGAAALGTFIYSQLKL